MCEQPNPQNYHYAVIARAIKLIDAGGPSQSLDDIAAAMNMSPSHFQRVFSAWAGVSPKRYQQYLTLLSARSLLGKRFTTLNVAETVGLSSSGRLHDLFLRWEAMTPGAYARAGEGTTIDWGWFDSPFGRVLLMMTDKGICGLAFATEHGERHTYGDMASRWPAARFVENPSRLEKTVASLFGSSEPKGKIPLHVSGAPFQIKVWEALLAIPAGRVTTYSEVASAINRSSAARAVGTAIGKNPISWLIPCHRVLQKSGGLGGYHWGLPVKKALLAYEAAGLNSDFSD
ncbi:MAG: methylated-DNA--[protein]-cysteine S-methyltransferase [Aestuariivita sp.]|nr:methylated-DNA--[protein]-cysteine S-methyltransferase [Aestuariivita sp.]MCY4203368.1 methylated-DNA--[protein]-cysteine S-methyltransferase [Aestuariivita sp.]MCY4287607.1 methylated-DNA--[protein]-cysteine S-methyltransferase [Aestuariivita sp.]MCY4346097.1 methylated-DNA--[protein]-cysteine S-methyltransferase [Aestuariivita sp.]